jgi:hypothetical protein
VVILLGALVPALAAIWTVPWFVPQDAPAHVYNAQILATSFDPASPFRDVYTVTWQPIPNWAGSMILAGLVAILPAWVADRIMTSLTLAAFATAVFWLRWRVAGGRGLGVAALLAVLLAMNIAWLLGFTNFMLGACLFPITLGLWWPARDRLSVSRLVALALLLTLGYFCHLVSLGLTIGGLVVLSLASPVKNDGESRWRQRFSRLAKTCGAFVPVVLLGLWYLSIATQRAPMRPLWRNLSDPWSPRAWVVQFGWVDPISLAIRDGLPLSGLEWRPFTIFAPVFWLTVAVTFWWYGRITAQSRFQGQEDRRCWLVLSALLIFGGAAGPDSLGAAHGEFLPQRVTLLGLVALVPIFDIDLAIAVAFQSAIIWDYALYSDRTAGQMIRAGKTIGRNQRIATLLVSTRSRFRSNPLLHADNWLGVDTGNVVWNNYETLHYYFPVHFRPEVDRPSPADLEWVSLHEGSSEAEQRTAAWERILSGHAHSIDVVVVWKSDPALDAITTRWFDRVDRHGDVQIFRRGALQPN